MGTATTWTLDDATNWNTRTVAGTPTTYSINGRNQLTAVGATPVTYDNNFSISGGLGVNYTHDQAGRLTAADSTTLTYDAASRLYGVGAGTRFLYVGAQIAGEYDAAGNLTVRHIPGPGLDDVVMSRGALAASRRWPLVDERGSVFAQTEGNSILAGVVQYDAYGASATPLGRFGYTGQPWLPQAAAYHYRNRNYLPQVGRFMETDPIGYEGGMNLFAYVGADPMNAVDPFGLARLIDRDKCVPAGGTIVERDRRKYDRDACNFEFVAFFDGRGARTGGGMGRRTLVALVPNPDSGEELPECVVNYLQPRVDFPLDGVRIHNAIAPFSWFNSSVTFGQNIYLGNRDYMLADPDQTGHLFHEIAHVPQWMSGRLTTMGAIFEYISAGGHDNAWFEREARAFTLRHNAEFWSGGHRALCE